MDIKEAIIHARQVAEGCGVDSRDCAYQHDCIADWLEELQAYRALGPVEELAMLAKARNEGRVVVLPCKVGDTVYWLHGGAITECRVHRIQWNRSGLFLCLKSTVSHGAFRVDSIGKTLFLTRAGAEAAQEGGPHEADSV